MTEPKPKTEPGTASPTAGPERVARCLVTDVELSCGTLALVTVAGDPPAKPTTLGRQGLAGLRATLHAQRARAEAGQIVALAVTGADRWFVAGADLRVMAAIKDPAEARDIAEAGHRALRLLGEMPVPTFAFINGVALGGGLELALHCTYRTAAADARTLGLPEVYLGLVPGWGGCYLLPHLVGVGPALELILHRPLAGNRMTDARQAREMGVVDVVLGPEDFVAASLNWAADVVSGRVAVHRRPAETGDWSAAVRDARDRLGRRWTSVLAPRRALELVAGARTADRDTAFAAEDDALAELLMSPELRASLHAFDITTRAARTPAGVPAVEPRPVRSVGIVGAGLMASQLAVLIANRLGVPVALREVDDERAAAGEARIRAQAETMAGKGKIDAAEGKHILGSITVGTDLAALARADLVIEAVTEVMSVKRAVFAELERVVGPDTVLATNTSALSVAEMAAGLERPGRVLGLHFFNPVAQLALVEVVRPQTADDVAVATGFAVAAALGKTAVGVADRPGFVVNRVLLRMLAEVAAAVEAGTPVDVADAALRPLGLPMGPFALLELVGLPVALHVLRTLHDDAGGRYRPSPGLERLSSEGRRLVLDDGTVDPAIADAFGGSAPLDADGVRKAVLTALAEEIGLMLDEGVVPSADQIDLCMILGAGWPMHLGGITPYLDRTGHSVAVLGQPFHAPGAASVPTD